MGDPFGALATQRRGDIPVFDGVQWQVSSNGQLASSTVPGWFFVNAAQGNIFDGSAAVPVTAERPSFQVVRWEAQGGGQVQNSAIQAVLIANNTLAGGTSQAIRGYAEQRNAGDIIGIDSTSVIVASPTGTGQAAYGFYTATADFSGTGYVVGFNAALQVKRDQAYTVTPPFSNAAFMQALLVSGGTTGQAYRVPFAYGAYANTPADVLFDVGFAAILGVKAAAFRDDTTATTSYLINGTHTVGIDMSGATNTTHIKFGANFYIDAPAGSVRCVVSATAQWDYILANKIFRWVENSVVLGELVAGTPGANKTSLFILEGATPTLRQVTTFDPGAAGINFTAGQLVCVAV